MKNTELFSGRKIDSEEISRDENQFILIESFRNISQSLKEWQPMSASSKKKILAIVALFAFALSATLIDAKSSSNNDPIINEVPSFVGIPETNQNIIIPERTQIKAIKMVETPTAKVTETPTEIPTQSPTEAEELEVLDTFYTVEFTRAIEQVMQARSLTLEQLADVPFDCYRPTIDEDFVECQGVIDQITGYASDIQVTKEFSEIVVTGMARFTMVIDGQVKSIPIITFTQGDGLLGIPGLPTLYENENFDNNQQIASVNLIKYGPLQLQNGSVVTINFGVAKEGQGYQLGTFNNKLISAMYDEPIEGVQEKLLSGDFEEIEALALLDMHVTVHENVLENQ